MLTFNSGISNSVNSKSAITDCISSAFDGEDVQDCAVLVIHSTVGHNFKQLLAAAKDACPTAEIIGCTGSGVIGREGVSESMRALAVMAVSGDEVAVVSRTGLNGNNSAELAEDAARELSGKLAGTNMIYILSAGLDISGNNVIEGVEKVFGADLPIFGATAADNGKAKGTFQFHGEDVMEDGIIMVGFADPSLEVLMGVHHGSVPLEGMTFEVTKSENNHIIELDGGPAWPALMAKLGLPPESETGDTLPITGLGIDLDETDSGAYDNPQILYVPIKKSEDHQSFYLPTSVAEGTKMVLMQRDEQYIFDGLDRLMERMAAKLDGRRPVAVFHADCMARGRHMFNRVLKDEIIAKMQYPLCGDDTVPWLGLYGYSEFCQINGKNRFHSYTTSLFPLVRNEVA
ncbi:MAG: FIST C-terminal domain-containing protein [Rhodospirillales bacterium]|nr:FIST C-terminal domain-containing protein [Rhodospirillales bacterium]